MKKPRIPVSRLRPFFGQPPTAGIPRRAGWGLGVASRIPKRFVAGLVLTLGIIPPVPQATPAALGLTINSQVRNERIVNRGHGRIIVWNPPTKILAAIPPITVHTIFRKPLTPISRLRPWFGQMIPVATVSFQYQTARFKIFSRTQTFERTLRKGYVIRTGPKLTGESALISPKTSNGLIIRSARRPVRFVGNVIGWTPPKGTFAIAVNKIPKFLVIQNRNSYESRRPEGSNYRVEPSRETQIFFGPLNVVRGPEVVLFGQTFNWGPRRPNIGPPGQIKRPIKISIRYTPSTLNKGRVLTFSPERLTIVALSESRVKGLNIVSRQFISPRYYDTRGRVLYLTSLRKNPTSAGSLNHGLIRLSNFRISLSVKRENDGGKIDVFAADASGTVVSFNKAFKIVESITLTPLTTALQSATYDFNHATQDPTTFLAKLFNSSGTRINGVISWKARGIL